LEFFDFLCVGGWGKGERELRYHERSFLGFSTDFLDELGFDSKHCQFFKVKLRTKKLKKTLKYNEKKSELKKNTLFHECVFEKNPILKF